MSILSEMKKKYDSKRLATATHATPATKQGELHEEVAKVATVAVANPWEGETEEAANDNRQERVEGMLAINPELKYAVLVDNSDADPVIVTIGIRGLAIFDMEIPPAHYDGLALLQIIEEHSMQETEGGNTQASTDAKESILSLPENRRKTA